MKKLTAILIMLMALIMLISCESVTETEVITEYVTDTLYISNPEQGELIQLTIAGDPCMVEIEHGLNGHNIGKTVFSNWMQDLYVDAGDSLYFHAEKPLNNTHVTMSIYRDGKMWKMLILSGDNNIGDLRVLVE